MKVYGDLNSGNCLKVKYTLDYLKRPYEWITVDITVGESKKREFLDINPAGQVPVVVLNGGQAIAQSNAIIKFIAKDSPLLPSDDYENAKVDEWLFWEQYSHEPYIAVCRYHMYYLKKSKASREQWRVDRGEAALDIMDKHLSNQTWIVSSNLTVADIALLAYTRLAQEGGFDLQQRLNIRRWISASEQELEINSTK